MSDIATPASKASKPVYTLRDGAIEIAVWKNDSNKGPFYSVTPRRSYRKGDQWKESDSYARDDLLVLARLVEMAYAWIITHAPEERVRNKAA